MKAFRPYIVVGILPNDAVAVRLVGALMLEQSDEPAVSRRYFSLASLAKLADTSTCQPGSGHG